MRKFVLAAIATVFTVGLALAADVVFVKYDKDTSKLTVKEGDKESTYTVTDATKVIVVDKDGKETEGKIENAKKAFDKMKEGKSKFSVTVDKEKITEIKMKGKK